LPNSNNNPNGASFPDRARILAAPLFYLSRNTVSLIGVVLATSLFFTMVILYLADFYGVSANPYLGIIAYLILPGIFLLGLILIPIGILLKHHREVREKTLPEKYPKVDFNRPELRRVVSFIVLVTVVNALIFIHASYQGVRYMDSARFCGQVCHNVMQPEFTAYKNSPHSRVECVSCHIGPGASWFVKSKLSGVRQVLAVALNSYPRPIPTPIKNLRPARETCEQCHWPSKFSGSLLAIRPKYAEDEQNSATKSVLMLKVGGGNGGGAGIHGTHLDLARQITYLTTDRDRQQIPYVRYTAVNGKVTEFAAADWNGNQSAGELRTMDCMDCHNRPTHTYQLPDQALDESLAAGRIAASLPFVKKKGLELLKQPYTTQAAGLENISRTLLAYYQQSYPQIFAAQRQDVENAAREIQAIYQRNVFPEMKIVWGTYPNNIGHTTTAGCFRCHDGSHTAKDGAAITQDCNACHQLLAVDEANPKILQDLTLLRPDSSAALAQWASAYYGPRKPATNNLSAALHSQR
jgi:nitrate/TMAO reductase-like tetraheme cytochrome c subunit